VKVGLEKYILIPLRLLPQSRQRLLLFLMPQ